MPARHRRLFLSALAIASAAFAQAPVHLAPGCPIYLADSAPGPVRLAVKDLQRDLKAVLGAESPMRSTATAGPEIVIRIAAPSATTGREAHAVLARDGKVVLEGADARGAIYAIYTFSEGFLGVPPLWFWSSWVPQRKNAIDVPAATNLRFSTPYVRWRTWFPNDEDLLTPWRARSQENYEAFLETMLRLKMNTLEGELMDRAGFDHPYQAGRQFRLARDRGFAVTGHHMRIFGSDYHNWDAYWTKIRKQDPPPKLAVANVSALEDFWRYHIETGMREKLEMVWLTGFRGDRDIPFWQTFPDAPASDAERAKVIQDMMYREVALLKKTTGDPAPVMRVTLYNENSDFFAQGLLRPPDEPNLIWVFVAARRDHFPAADVRGYNNDRGRPIGYYLNFQFTSSGAHLAQAEGPWKMEANFRAVNAISGRPLELSVVNAGNVREFLLELSANARMMWDFNGYSTDAFLREFCSQYFGPENAAAAAALYHDFYNSYWRQKKPDLAGFDRQYLFQDMRYARALEQILPLIPKGRNLNPLNERAMSNAGEYFRIVPADSAAASQIEAIRNGTALSITRLEDVVKRAEALAPSISSGRRQFFVDNLLVQAKLMLHLNRVLNATAEAMDAMPDKPKSAASLNNARQHLRLMREVMREAEHDKFSGWYGGDRLFGVEKISQRIDAALEALR